MTPENTDGRPLRRKQAVISALVSGLWLIVSALVLLWLRRRFWPDGTAGILLAGIAILDVGLLIPLGISLKHRLQEIQGGEEDEAGQY